jgi:hypothetical protein
VPNLIRLALRAVLCRQSANVVNLLHLRMVETNIDLRGISRNLMEPKPDGILSTACEA